MKKAYEEAMKPGVKYAGYGILNEFREFQFVPAQKGANQGRMKCVKQGDGWAVHSTRDNIIIHLRFKRRNKIVDMIADYLKLHTTVVDILRDYDLSVQPPTTKKK